MEYRRRNLSQVVYDKQPRRIDIADVDALQAQGIPGSGYGGTIIRRLVNTAQWILTQR